LTYSFRPHCGPGIDSASNRNEYQEYFLVGLSWPVLRADNLTTFMFRFSWKIWEPQPPGNLRDCPGQYRECFTFITQCRVEVSV